jgi:hypothetical protein
MKSQWTEPPIGLDCECVSQSCARGIDFQIGVSEVDRTALNPLTYSMFMDWMIASRSIGCPLSRKA